MSRHAGEAGGDLRRRKPQAHAQLYAQRIGDRVRGVDEVRGDPIAGTQRPRGIGWDVRRNAVLPAHDDVRVVRVADEFGFELAVQELAFPDTQTPADQCRHRTARVRVVADRNTVRGPVERLAGEVGEIARRAVRRCQVLAADQEQGDDEREGRFHLPSSLPLTEIAMRCTGRGRLNPTLRSAGVRKRWTSYCSANSIPWRAPNEGA